jgi:hypothetical protein
MKLYPELRHGVFMDEDAQIVVQDALTWIGEQAPTQEEASVAATLAAQSKSKVKLGSAI